MYSFNAGRWDDTVHLVGHGTNYTVQMVRLELHSSLHFWDCATFFLRFLLSFNLKFQIFSASSMKGCQFNAVLHVHRTLSTAIGLYMVKFEVFNWFFKWEWWVLTKSIQKWHFWNHNELLLNSFRLRTIGITNESRGNIIILWLAVRIWFCVSSIWTFRFFHLSTHRHSCSTRPFLESVQSVK